MKRDDLDPVRGVLGWALAAVLFWLLVATIIGGSCVPAEGATPAPAFSEEK